jgi:hypothetical protein
MNNYYVYAHQRQSDGKCFYIGKGKNYRAWDKTKRNQYWKSTVNKHGLNVVILVNNISEDKAFELEKSFIQQIGLENLTNLTDGGEGISGYKRKFTEEHKAKISAASVGRKKSEESKAKMSLNKKGKSFNEEHKAKISAAKKGQHYGPMNEMHKANLSASTKGKKKSDEFKAKRREIMKEYWRLKKIQP